MAILDTPITTDDRSLNKILAQNLPVMLIFHKDDLDRPLEDTLAKEAKRHAGDLLIARLAVADANDTYIKYGEPPTPAIVSLTTGEGFFNKRKVLADAERIRPKDVRAHVKHIVDGEPLPAADSGKAKNKRSNAPIHVTDQSFRKVVLKSKKPVLVDFWADWCGPCHAIAPHIEKLAQEYGDQVTVAKLDVDNNQVMSRRYNVSSIPTMIIFEGGQPAERITGANPVAVRKAVEKYTR